MGGYQRRASIFLMPAFFNCSGEFRKHTRAYLRAVTRWRDHISARSAQMVFGSTDLAAVSLGDFGSGAGSKDLGQKSQCPSISVFVCSRSCLYRFRMLV